MEAAIYFAGLVILQAVNLWVIMKISRESVSEAARKASDTTRKNMENKLYKYYPWLRGFKPNNVVQMKEIEEVDEDGEYVGPGILGR